LVHTACAAMLTLAMVSRIALTALAEPLLHRQSLLLEARIVRQQQELHSRAVRKYTTEYVHCSLLCFQ
jgi:hypothetical protein